MKKILTLILTVVIIQNVSFGQKKDYYTIEKIKDILIKYENPFEAFDKLALNKIPIEQFKQDSFLMEKSL